MGKNLEVSLWMCKARETSYDPAVIKHRRTIFPTTILTNSPVNIDSYSTAIKNARFCIAHFFNQLCYSEAAQIVKRFDIYWYIKRRDSNSRWKGVDGCFPFSQFPVPLLFTFFSRRFNKRCSYPAQRRQVNWKIIEILF